MLNRVILMGRIKKELEIRQSQSGTAVLRFSVAVDRPQKNGEKSADFISCIAFGQTAEFISRYFGKGRMIAIEGNIKTGSYQNKNGDTVYTTDVIVERTSFTGEQKSAQSAGTYQGYNNTIVQSEAPQGAGQTYTGSGYSDFEEVISVEGVPF